jgi:hypothetical protein
MFVTVISKTEQESQITSVALDIKLDSSRIFAVQQLGGQ